MLDLAIVGATAVTPSGVAPADVGVSRKRSRASRAPGALESAQRTIDARGMLLLPGAVDPHTHLDAEMFRMHTADDFESGTAAAAAGGVTTIIDYAFQPQGGSLADAIEKWNAKARGRAIIDYGFHVAILDPSPESIAEIPRIVERGVTSFKIFMMQGFEASRARFPPRVQAPRARAARLLAIHAEDEHLIGFCTERLLAAGNRRRHAFRRQPSAVVRGRRGPARARMTEAVGRARLLRASVEHSARSMKSAARAPRAAPCSPRRGPSICI